jgi:hypothetical protein
MSVKIVPPFKLALRLPEDGTLDPDEIGLEKLRDVVAGKDTSFPRRAAMALLLTSDFPNKDEDFAAVLEDEQVPGRIRYMAAVMLAKVDTRAAQDILIRNLRIRDERVCAGVLIGLGRIGDSAALEALAHLKDDSKPARFAATLIAHRLGVEGHDAPVPDDSDLLGLADSAARPMQWQRPDPADIRFCLRSLTSDPFGIAFAQEPVYQVRCGGRELMVLFNRELVAQDTIKWMRERKTLAGVVALRNETNGLYSVSLLILTSPSRKTEGFNLMLYQTNGALAYAGRASVGVNSTEFSIRALSRPGAFPIRFEGTLQDGRVEIKTALSALFVQSLRRPGKGLGPETPRSESD